MTDLLRLATAGSVDDGKSTLIGRLLYDAKAILADQMEHVEEVSKRRGSDVPDLALLTDGLRAEREQGITIDVAYRYFATPKRKFILADTPGHVQYTRNMVTGASTADLAIVLVDARHGVVEQTRRHAFLASLLGIRHLVLAVNKMDLVDWEQATYDRVVADFGALAEQLRVPDVVAIPMSALLGDNIVDRSANLSWYDGPALLEHLEAVEVHEEIALEGARFPVQYVIRDQATDYRGYAGQVAGGVLRVGDAVQVLPGGRTTTVAAIDTFEGEIVAAPAGQSVTVRLADDIDVARGDLLAAGPAPLASRELTAEVCWMAEAPLRAGGRYALKAATSSVRAIVDEVSDRLDVANLTAFPGPAELALNDIGRVRLRVSRELAVDPYAVNRATGSFILVDEASNETVGAGMVLAPT
ncbi:MAG: 50S ribosome-binding GTPase [Solirubrobacterales bacterium]|nr:50S ribosome-binding GTPase [Solirubrobacterales bacterium]